MGLCCILRHLKVPPPPQFSKKWTYSLYRDVGSSPYLDKGSMSIFRILRKKRKRATRLCGAIEEQIENTSGENISGDIEVLYSVIYYYIHRSGIRQKCLKLCLSLSFRLKKWTYFLYPEIFGHTSLIQIYT